MTTTIEIDPADAYLATALAELRRRAPNNEALHRAFDVADVALVAVEAALEQPLPDLSTSAHRAYLAAIVLAKTIDAFPTDMFNRDRIARYRCTALKMLALLERFVSPADRALRSHVLDASISRGRVAA